MKPGDLVKHKCSPGSRELVTQYGTFMGMRTFKANGKARARDYVCAEVLWFNRRSPTGSIISTIQKDLIEVVNESR